MHLKPATLQTPARNPLSNLGTAFISTHCCLRFFFFFKRYRETLATNTFDSNALQVSKGKNKADFFSPLEPHPSAPAVGLDKAVTEDSGHATLAAEARTTFSPAAFLKNFLCNY